MDEVIPKNDEYCVRKNRNKSFAQQSDLIFDKPLGESI